MKNLSTSLLILITMSSLLGDGLLLSNNENYPGDFLRNRATIIDVDVEELYATTTVYQEFVNDWSETTDGVWSFPLPYDARSIQLLYTRHDTTFEAILIESSQSINPGTGDGGIAALVNDYVGVNGLKLQLMDIEPGAIQKVELTYISLLDFFQGECHYEYPLETADFIDYPVEHLQLNININSARELSDFNLNTHPGYEIISASTNNLVLEMSESMAYLNRNIEFTYTLANNSFGRDFFSALNSEVDGHFAFFLTPPNLVNPEEILNRKIVFLLSTSATMSGYKLQASVAALHLALDELNASDLFNIISYNFSTNQWRTILVVANETNIASARAYLDGLSASGGSRMDLGLEAAIEQFDDDSYHNSILAFTDGHSPVDPFELATLNAHNVAIFPVAFGDNVDHSRLDMTARMNLGFVTYLDLESDLVEGIHRVFQIINQPIFHNVTMDFNKDDVHDIFPETFPSTYAGAYSRYSGRYMSGGPTSLDYWGVGVAGSQQYGFALDFTDDSTEWDIPAYLWAKDALDNLEQLIDIYGETPTLKDSSVALSLRYQMRCRYTAYFADYEEVVDPPANTDENLPLLPQSSYLAQAYPNPFNPVTTFTIVIGEDLSSAPLLLNIYDLRGRLVASIDLSYLGPGQHQLSWFAKNMLGQELVSGVYFAVLETNHHHGKPLKLLLLK